ncbi:LysM peptidoglycan-binding domain-containing protein [Ligilactobacillus acidipiscis]|uniref:LysM peptidoglycan-binding domain-containing protein n=1 Tax=Ligilactobacillus acidipiscis TaxID=89059 RepID=UPI00386F36B7
MNNSTKSLLVGTIGAASLFLAGNAGVSADTTHKVANHDTVWGLSQKYGVSIQSIEQLNHISSNSHLIYPGQNVQIPDKDAKTTPVKATTPKQTANTSTYSVKAGDSLWTIAQAHKTTVAKLMSLNNLNSSVLQAGQTLKVVGTVAAQPAVQPKVQVKTQQPKVQPAQQQEQPQISANHVNHSVVSGESLYTIANKYGVSVDSIRQANALKSAAVTIGQSLVINNPTKDPNATSATQVSAQNNNDGQQSQTQSNSAQPVSAQNNNSNGSASASSRSYQAPKAQAQNTSTQTPASQSQARKSVNSAGNTYAMGQCTWYVKSVASWAGNNWGNGQEWANSARQAGFRVDNTPSAGSIAVYAGGANVGGWIAAPGYGHVAYVERVNGSSVTISQGGEGFSNPTGPNEQTLSAGSATAYIHP